MAQEIPIVVQMTALAQALCNIMAVPYAELQVLRELLDRKELISKEEFESAKNAFPHEKFQEIASSLNKQVLLKVEQIIQKMMRRERVQ